MDNILCTITIYIFCMHYHERKIIEVNHNLGSFFSKICVVVFTFQKLWLRLWRPKSKNWGCGGNFWKNCAGVGVGVVIFGKIVLGLGLGLSIFGKFGWVGVVVLSSEKIVLWLLLW